MTEQVDHKGFAAIVKAIAKATGEVKRLAKDNKNTEQKYEFASVDDFLAMTGPILAANGLVILMDEVGCENVEKQGKYGVTQWAKYTYVFEVMHESGQMLRPVTRTVEVIRSGAQASGSAQSYALKQFERSLLQIPTGDKDDPDHGEKSEPSQARQAHQRPDNQQRARPITAEEYQAMKKMMDDTETNADNFAKFLGVSHLQEISIDLHETAMKALKQKADKLREAVV